MMHAMVRNGDLVADLFLPDTAKANGIGIVWCPGLPNMPVTEDVGLPLADTGFVVLQVKYPGSWQSYGSFGPSSSIEGALQALELLASGGTTDLITERPIRWTLDRLVLAGNSYGGGVAACALASSSLADAAVLFCPLLDPANQNQDASRPEDDLSTLLPYLKRCQANVFRGIDEREWDDFLLGRSRFNPGAHLGALHGRSMLMIHGREDRTIQAYHTERYYERLLASAQPPSATPSPSKLLLVDGIGHGRALRAATWKTWTEWIMRRG